MSTFADTVISPTRFFFEGGYKPLDKKDGTSCLIMGGVEAARQITDPGIPLDTGAARVKLEVQTQAPVPAGKFYFRIETSRPVTEASSQTTVAEAVYQMKGEPFVLRSNFTNTQSADGKPQSTLAIAPFMRTTVELPYVGNIGIRFTPEYSRNIQTGTNGLLVHTKLDGTIANNPWWGWGIQVFLPVNIENTPGVKPIDFSGTYLWTGRVLPKGWFLESGVYLGKSNFLADNTVLALLTIKAKNGSENRWWQ